MKLIDLYFRYDQYHNRYEAWSTYPNNPYSARYIWNGELTIGKTYNYKWHEKVIPLPPAIKMYMFLRYPL